MREQLHFRPVKEYKLKTNGVQWLLLWPEKYYVAYKRYLNYSTLSLTSTWCHFFRWTQATVRRLGCLSLWLFCVSCSNAVSVLVGSCSMKLLAQWMFSIQPHRLYGMRSHYGCSNSTASSLAYLCVGGWFEDVNRRSVSMQLLNKSVSQS